MQLHGLQGWQPLNGRPGLRMAVWPQGQSPACSRCIYACSVCDM